MTTAQFNHYILRSVFNLKLHMMSKKHGWPKEKALNAKKLFGLDISREKLPEASRRSKVRNYDNIFICPLSVCNREIRRVGNHLRQFHDLPKEIARYLHV